MRNLKILVDEKLRTNIGFNLKPPRALYLVLWPTYIDSPEGQKCPMNQLEIRSSTIYRAKTFKRSVSHQEHSSLKISALKDHSKRETFCEGRGGGLILFIKIENILFYPWTSVLFCSLYVKWIWLDKMKSLLLQNSVENFLYFVEDK